MNHPASAAAIAMAALALPLAAQGSQVLPPANATVDGNALDIQPFGSDQSRYVHYVDRALFGSIPANALIKDVSYRRDAQLTAPATMVRTRSGNPYTPIWQVRMGRYTGDVFAPTGNYPAVSDPNFTIVYSQKATSFPSLTLPGGGVPPAFAITFLFDVPWVFPATGHIAVEHYAYEATNAAYTYVIDAVGPGGAGGTADLIAPNTLGCPAGENRAAGAVGSPGNGDLLFNLFGAEPGKGAFACLGVSTTTWGGLPLPYDLGALGLAGCKIYTDLSVVVPRTTTPFGTAEFRILLPDNPALAGQTLYGQWVAADSRVNPAFPYATSDGVRFTIGTGGTPRMSVVSGTGGLANGTFGLIQPGRGPVFQLSW